MYNVQNNMKWKENVYGRVSAKNKILQGRAYFFIFIVQNTIIFLVSSISVRARQKLMVHLETDNTLSFRVTDEQITKS